MKYEVIYHVSLWKEQAARLVSEQRQQFHSIAVTGKQHFEIQLVAQKAIPWFNVMFLRTAEKYFEETGGPLK